MTFSTGKFRFLAGSALAAGAIAVGATAAGAQEYPTGPVNVTVAYGPGGATDFQARTVTLPAAEEEFLGQPIIIVNRPGAGGRVGWNWWIDEGDKEGYDLAAYNVPHMIAQWNVFDTSYNIDNVEPIANWGADPAVLIVGADSEFDSVDDVVAFAEENPGQLSVSGAGMYVGHHIAALQFEQAAEVDINYIPAEGGGVQALQFVMGGQVDAGFNNLADAYRNQDSLKILAVADTERNEEFLPDVPTFQELGYDIDDSSVNFRGIAAPAGTPDEVIDYLAEVIPEMFRYPAVGARMADGGSPMRVMDRDEVVAMFQERDEYLRELLADIAE